MLSIEQRFESKGVVLFRDHENTNLFYYSAPPPKMSSTSGRPMFDLHVYSVELEHSPLSGTKIPEELGAGFLTMGVECHLDKTEENAIAHDISNKLQIPPEQIMLNPIPYHKGSVTVLALDKYKKPGEAEQPADSATPLKGRPTFVEQVLGSATPALLGNLRAIFSLSLSQEGVSFLEGLYKDQAAPVGVVYELSFYGLQPAVEARITADLSRIYQHFGGGLQVQYKFISADISAGLDYLQEKGAVKVELTTQATGEQAQKSKELALSLFKDQIVKDMFKPTSQSSTADAMRTAGGLAGAASKMPINLRLKYIKKEELKTVTYDFREIAPVERTDAPQGFLPALLTEQELAQRIHHVDLRNEFFELLQVLVTGPIKEEFKVMNIRQVDVSITYGEPGDEVQSETRTISFRSDDTGDKVFAVKRQGRKSLAYKYVITYEFSRGTGVDADSFRYELKEKSATARTLRINPYADFGLLDVDVVPGRIHPDIKEVDVYLTYGAEDDSFSAEEQFRLYPKKDSTKTYHWQVRTLSNEVKDYSAQYTFIFEDNSTYKSSPHIVSDPMLRIDSPFQHNRLLLIKPNVVSDEISQILLEIKYEDTANNYKRQFLVQLDPPFNSHQISWPILNPDIQTIQYRITVHEPGFISETEWEETSDPSLIVGARGSRVGIIDVRLIGPSLAEVNIDALMVKVQLISNGTENEELSFLMEGDMRSYKLKLTIPPDSSLHYRYKTSAYKSDGQVVESDWKEMRNPLLPISTRQL